MLSNKELVRRGSLTAKNGFKNEQFVIDEFNDWHNSVLAQQWLVAMEYMLSEIESVKAIKVKVLTKLMFK